MTAREKGMDFTPAIVDRIVAQLAAVGVETVNLGGNEPLFTNGPNPADTLLPRIIHGLADAGILVGLTTSGITLTHLHRDHEDAFGRLNDSPGTSASRGRPPYDPQARRPHADPPARVTSVCTGRVESAPADFRIAGRAPARGLEA